MTDPKEAVHADVNEIVKRVVEERQRSGMSVLEVAAKMGVSPTTVRRFESLPSNPTLAMLMLYVAATGGRVDAEIVERE